MKQELCAMGENEFDNFLTERANELAQKFLILRFKEYDDTTQLFNDEVKNLIINEIGTKYGCLLGETAINIYYQTLKEFISDKESEEIKKQELSKLARAEKWEKLSSTFVNIFKALSQILSLSVKIIVSIFAIFILIITFICPDVWKKEKRRR